MKCWHSCYIVLVFLASVTNTDASSEGRSFAVAFHQLKSDFTDGDCTIYMMAKQETEVTIYEPEGGIDTFTIFPNGLVWKAYSSDYRVIQSLEQEKAFIIEADNDISVMLSNYREDGHMGTTSVLPRQENGYDHMIISFPSVDEFSCATYTTCSFYTVTAFEDETLVEVYRLMEGYPRRLRVELIDRHYVMANRTRHTPDDRQFDHTGYLIHADKPVSVNAGNACGNTLINRYGSTLWSAMPVVEDVGSSYITHTMSYRGYAGPLLVRVVALSNETEVMIGGSIDTIPYAGEVLQYEISSDENVKVECDKSCLVAQYSVNNINVTPGGSGVSMAVLVPNERYTDSVIFTKPNAGSSTNDFMDYVSIVYDTETPEDEPLFFNGQELTGWNVYDGQGFSSLEFEMEGDRNRVYYLSSSSGRRFSALVHGHADGSKGYAYIAGFGDAA